jgi:regulator of RNase E activity RraA
MQVHFRLSGLSGVLKPSSMKSPLLEGRAFKRDIIRTAALALVLHAMVSAPLHAQSSADRTTNSTAELRYGKSFIATPLYSEADDQRILAVFEGLRVADVSDGMDAVGLQNIGLMDSEILPLWRDTQKFTHRFIGIAVTARYVPTQLPPAGRVKTEEYDKWVGDWYKNKSSEPFVALLRKGSALVIEDAAEADVGSIGSNNIMSWKLKGCVGVVTSATARDTDEIITEKVPLYFRKPGRGIRPGRNEIESVNRPIVCGGVTVMPGDVIVADGDGVIVVPRPRAEEVAKYAKKILDEDKAGRRKLYEKLGLPADDSVK